MKISPHADSPQNGALYKMSANFNQCMYLQLKSIHGIRESSTDFNGDPYTVTDPTQNKNMAQKFPSSDYRQTSCMKKL